MPRALVLLLLALASMGVAVPVLGQEEPPALTFPQPDPATVFIDDFGHARRGHRHQGNDLMGEKGIPVVAAAAGFVQRMAHHHSAGYYLVLQHEGGWTTTYMHLNNDLPTSDGGRGGAVTAYAPGIAEGVQVEAGQLIGWVGDSGNAEWTGPHTHFELAHEGRVINPYPYLVVAWREFLNRYTIEIAEQRSVR